MMFYGYHGDYPEERKLGQKFIVDVEMMSDLQAAGREDCLDLSVNYVEVFNKVKFIVEEEQYNIIEALAERIATEILKYDLIVGVVVKIKKPHAAIPQLFGEVEVEILREK